MHSTNNRNTRVILLRHGESTYNALKLYQGSSDRPILTEIGRYQAQQTGTFLKQIKFDAIYSSPLKRARETAQEVMEIVTPSCDINIVPELRETHLPAWQGLPFQQVREQFPEEYRCWKQTPHELRMEISSGEHQEAKTAGNIFTKSPVSTIAAEKYFFPGLDVYNRAQRFWQEILPRHIGETLLVVSHGGTTRALISTALGISPAHYHNIEQSNCGLSILNFPNGQLESAKLKTMNSATHVGEYFPPLKEGGNGFRLLLVPTETQDDEQIENLVRALKDIDIDFSISGDLDGSQAISDRILVHHPTTVQLQVSRDDFAKLWHQSLMARNRQKSELLLTALVAARSPVIEHFIAQIFGLDSNRLWRLQLQPGTLSIVRYYDTEHPPVLQAMNVAGI